MSASSLLLLLACGAPTDDTGTLSPDPTFDCEPGLLGVDDAFEPLAGLSDAELVLGFQGFLFVRFALARDAAGPEPLTVTLALEAEGSDPFSSVQPEVTWFDSGDGWRTDELLLFLPDANTAAWTDVEAAVALKAEHSDGHCTVTGQVRFVDDDPCIHTGEEPICPGDDTGVDP